MGDALASMDGSDFSLLFSWWNRRLGESPVWPAVKTHDAFKAIVGSRKHVIQSPSHMTLQIDKARYSTPPFFLDLFLLLYIDRDGIY